jgi:hypothetical protein
MDKTRRSPRSAELGRFVFEELLRALCSLRFIGICGLYVVSAGSRTELTPVQFGFLKRDAYDTHCRFR